MATNEEIQIPVGSLLFVEQGDKPPVYQELYEIGYPMPPIVVSRRRGGKFEILDGNKRGRSAIAAKCATINAVLFVSKS